MLVVDDDHSFQVFVAGNAEEGIRLFRKHHPAAVLLDVHLGDGQRDGISLCDQIRDDISSEFTAILILSAERRSAEDQIKGRTVGADTYVLKPVKLTDLESRLNEILRKKRAPAA